VGIIINQVFRLKYTKTDTRIGKTLTQTRLTYGSKAWTVCERHESRIMGAKMKFVGRMANYIQFDYKNFRCNELTTQPITQFIPNYRCEWKTHALQTPHSRIPLLIVHYQPKG
jgi:hypothetical protein